MGASCCKPKKKNQITFEPVAPNASVQLDRQADTSADNKAQTEEDLRVLHDRLNIYRQKVRLADAKHDQVAQECMKYGVHKAMLILKKKRRQVSLVWKIENEIRLLSSLVDRLHVCPWEYIVFDEVQKCEDNLQKLKVLVEDLGDCERILEQTDRGIQYVQQLSIHLVYGGEREDEEQILVELDQALRSEARLVPQAHTSSVAFVKSVKSMAQTKKIRKFDKDRLETICEQEDELLEMEATEEDDRKSL